MAESSRWRHPMALLAMIVGLIGCTMPAAPPPGGGGGRPTPSPSPFSPTTTTLNFDGSVPAPFEDPTTMEERYSTRYSAGRWLITNNEYRQLQEVQTATLMIQRYNGDAFGQPNGMASSKYRFEATVRAYRPVTASESIIAGAPVGVLGIIPYYLDTTHYIIIEAVKNRYEVWFVNGLTPGDEWNAELYRKFDMEATSSFQVNQPLRLGAEIDTRAGTMRLFINDEMQAVLSDPSFIRDVQHSVALVANGNYVAYRDVTLSRLSAD